MADNVRRLDGTERPSDPSKRNVKVSRFIDEIVVENERGHIKALACVWITDRGSWVSGCLWPSTPNDEGFPWDLALRGALRALEAEMAINTVEVPDRTDPPDGA